MSKCVDFIGQEIVVGDWAVVTQHNALYVGKVVKAGTSVTIAVNAQDEFTKTSSVFKNAKGWEAKALLVKKKFGPHARPYAHQPSWSRDGKFIKITPTEEMMIGYDK
tara:strand:- start:259 stop:579 length:321 start_codon:yes stop_codon:yes gene_type:complete